MGNAATPRFLLISIVFCLFYCYTYFSFENFKAGSNVYILFVYACIGFRSFKIRASLIKHVISICSECF